MARLLEGAGIAVLRSRFNPASMFGKYQASGLYIPDINPARLASSGLSRLYTTSTGLTAVTAVADPVGFLIDESLRAAVGAELLANGGFDSDTAWTDIDQGTGTSTIAGGVVTLVGTDGSNRGRRSQSFSTTSGRWHRFRASCDNTGAVLTAGAGQGFETFSQATVAGVTTLFFRASAATMHVGFRNSSAGGTSVLDNASVVEVAGNHSSQSTANSRPSLRQDGSLYVLRGDGSDDNLLTTLNPATAMTMVWAGTINAVSDVMAGTNGAANERFFMGTDASGRLCAGVGAEDGTTIFGGADIRGVFGVNALRINGTTVTLARQEVGGAPTVVYTGAQNGGPTTSVPIRLLARNNNGTAADFANADMSMFFAIQAALTDAELYL